MGQGDQAGLEVSLSEARQRARFYEMLARASGTRRLREAEEMSRLIERLRVAEREVEQARDEMERRVDERTAELREMNERLRAEMRERSRVTEELRQSEERLRQATTSSNTALWDWDLRTNEVYFSPIWKRQIGYEDDEIPNRCEEWQNRVHPEDLDRTLTIIRAVVDRAGHEFETEFRFRHRNGSYRWILAKASLLHDGAGDPHRMVGSHIDITEQHLAREALRLSEEKFRGLVETTSDWIWQTDSEGRYTYASPRVSDLLGYTPEEVVGRCAFDFMPEEESARVKAEFARICREARPFFGLVNRNHRKDGKLVVLETSGVPRLDGQGKLVGFQGIDRDVTERVRDEEERLHMERHLQQVQKLESLGVLAGGIAHDFNNLLTTVLGNAELALEELPPSSPVRESLREIRETAVRAADLCRQMLAYSGKGRFVIETLVLRDLVTEMVQLLHTSISRKAQLNLRLNESLPPVRGDATQIRQIVMNLVINASEAIGEQPGVITVATGQTDYAAEALREGSLGEDLPAGPYVWLEVSDSGCGMDEDTREHAFEPFFTTKFTGRGLGLSAVLGIVRRHHGALFLTSRQGEGTTFRVLFPLSRDVPEPQRAERAESIPWQGCGTILLVDDEEMVRKMGGRLLERLGFQVLLAEDGREALARYQAAGPEISLVLLDLTMPHLNGEETYRELRKLNPNVRVLISSGYSEAEIASRFLGTGLAGFVQKPYTKEEMVRQLKQALEPGY